MLTTLGVPSVKVALLVGMWQRPAILVEVVAAA